jgi:hypothetical protein
LFLGVSLALVLILSNGNFVFAKYFISIFLSDLLIRVFINPKYSPSLIIGRLIVRNQVPEYVGAHQKKFAWIIGIIVAGTMFIFMVVMNTYSPITGILCLVCLIFLFFETSFGICLGCKIYPLIYKKRAQYCPGEVCESKSKQNIQKISFVQILVVLIFIGGIFLVAFLFNSYFTRQPHYLFGQSLSKSIQ